MSVGDVNSKAKGSGARFNDGKPAVELIPFRVIALTTKDSFMRIFLNLVDHYQFSGDITHLQDCVFLLQDYVPDCARVFDYGRIKYAEWNWLKGMKWSVPLACIGRHCIKIISGQELDDESGHSHWGHVLCNLAMLIMYAEVYPEGNDLPVQVTHAD